MSAFNFNANQEAPDAGRMGPVAAGWYAVMTKKLEHGVTGGGDGEKINAQFEISEGPHKGQSIFHNFNMKNQSETAEKIGRGQFSALCHATNQLMIQDLGQLYGINFKVKVKITTDSTGQYEPKNEITAFKQYNDPAAVNIVPGATAGPASVAKVVVPPPAAAPAVNPAATWAAGAPPAQAPAGAPALAPQPWAQPAAPAPAPAPAPTPAYVAPAGPVYTMTAAANGVTREAYLATAGWTDALLIQQGLMVAAAPAAPAPVAPPPPPAPPAPPAAPQPAWATAPVAEAPAAAAAAAPGQAPAATDPVAPITPPWMQPPAA